MGARVCRARPMINSIRRKKTVQRLIIITPLRGLLPSEQTNSHTDRQTVHRMDHFYSFFSQQQLLLPLLPPTVCLRPLRRTLIEAVGIVHHLCHYYYH